MEKSSILQKKKKPKMNANETRSPEAIAIDGGLMSFN